MTFIKILSLGDKNVRDYAEGNVQRFEQILFNFGRTFQRSDSADESFWGVHQLQTMALMLIMVSHVKANATWMTMTMTMIMFPTMSHCWGVLQRLTMGWTFLHVWLHWPNRFRKYPEANKRMSPEKEIIILGLSRIRNLPLKKSDIFGGDEQENTIRDEGSTAL